MAEPELEAWSFFPKTMSQESRVKIMRFCEDLWSASLFGVYQEHPVPVSTDSGRMILKTTWPGSGRWMHLGSRRRKNQWTRDCDSNGRTYRCQRSFPWCIWCPKKTRAWGIVQLKGLFRLLSHTMAASTISGSFYFWLNTLHVYNFFWVDNLIGCRWRERHSSAAHCLGWTWTRSRLHRRELELCYSGWRREDSHHPLNHPPNKYHLLRCFQESNVDLTNLNPEEAQNFNFTTGFDLFHRQTLGQRRFSWSLAFGKIWAKAAKVFWNLGYRTWQIRFFFCFCGGLDWESTESTVLFLSFSFRI